MNSINELKINCSYCTFLNIINKESMNIDNYCLMCDNLVYKPDDTILAQISEAEKRKNMIQENFKKAYDAIPSSFIPSNMIYLNTKIRNNEMTSEVRFLIDTGAQVSVLPLDVAKGLNIDNLIDESYNGELKGVGNDVIMGRIHYLEVELPFGTIPCSFTICKNPNMVPILGIDMMQHMGIVLDFVKRKIIFATNQTENVVDM